MLAWSSEELIWEKPAPETAVVLSMVGREASTTLARLAAESVAKLSEGGFYLLLQQTEIFLQDLLRGLMAGRSALSTLVKVLEPAERSTGTI